MDRSFASILAVRLSRRGGASQVPGHREPGLLEKLFARGVRLGYDVCHLNPRANGRQIAIVVELNDWEPGFGERRMGCNQDTIKHAAAR
jgi:hypothetical protein